jgi:hypothetical protein
MSETAKPRGYYDDQSDSTTGPGMASHRHEINAAINARNIV